MARCIVIESNWRRKVLRYELMVGNECMRVLTTEWKSMREIEKSQIYVMNGNYG